MNIEVLVTTMHATDISKFKEMNLQTDAVIANQADICAYSENNVDGHRVRLITTNTRGVSLNRNIAIAYSNADIVVFADDDQVFVDDYGHKILQEFEQHPEADAIKFHCPSINPDRPTSLLNPSKFKKAKSRNLMSGGINALAIRREALLKYNLLFPIGLGPGTKYYYGEDSVFLKSLFKQKLSVYISPTLVSLAKQENSSWFQGYEDRYFVTVGYVYAQLYRKLAIAAGIRRILKMWKKVPIEYTLRKMLTLIRKGISEYYKN